MKSRYRQRNWRVTLFALLVFVVAAMWTVQGVRDAAAASEAEGLKIARQAVLEAAVSCYALDGAYPASYEDLKSRSGVSVDEDKYDVFYDVFASNIMPEITVIAKNAPSGTGSQGLGASRRLLADEGGFLKEGLV